MANDAVWNRFISELLDKNDIVDVISSYIDVKPKAEAIGRFVLFTMTEIPRFQSIARDSIFIALSAASAETPSDLS